jgi:hypothetical protein
VHCEAVVGGDAARRCAEKEGSTEDVAAVDDRSSVRKRLLAGAERLGASETRTARIFLQLPSPPAAIFLSLAGTIFPKKQALKTGNNQQMRQQKSITPLVTVIFGYTRRTVNK